MQDNPKRSPRYFFVLAQTAQFMADRGPCLAIGIGVPARRHGFQAVHKRDSGWQFGPWEPARSFS